MKRDEALEILEKAEEILKKYTLCDRCLGRQFALLGYGLDNMERGSAIKTLLLMKADLLINEGDQRGVDLLKTLGSKGLSDSARATLRKRKGETVKKGECYVCEGKFELLDELTEKTIERLKEYEFRSFLIGIDLPREVEEREDELKAEFKVEYGENLRNEFSREIGKRISKKLSKKVDYKTPDLVVLINPFENRIEVRSNPLFIGGRYRKLKRGIPQTKWLCSKCMGRGCERCNWTGKMYPESIQELIAKPVLDLTLGKEAVLHAAGREDIDVLMLGDGRPFVIEVKEPKKRFLDLEELTERINEYAKGKVEVLNLQFVDRKTVREIKKSESAEKIYRAVVKFNREITDEEIEALEKTLNGAKITQRTPTRVLHRRADKIREKYIYETKIKKLMPDMLEFRIRSEGGLYIKELIDGDGGRTRPSVADIIGVEGKVEKLDVLKVVKSLGGL